MATNVEEREEQDVCVDCGAVISSDLDRAFACGPDTYLCFVCAERRGGVYEELEDRWTVPPDVTAVPDERRPHA